MTTPSFDTLDLSPQMRSAIAATGFTSPTPVQQGAIPALLSGRDIVIQAQTGTGKTAAFAIPTIERIDPAQQFVQALVLAPTRELAQQIAREFKTLSAGREINAVAIFGGAGMDEQRRQLADAHVIVATPGRLLDFLRRRDVDLFNVRFFGLDEADEMLSMGFEKDVLDVIAQLPSTIQSFLCSATYNDTIRRISSQFMTDPVEVNVSSDELGARNIRHVVYRVPFVEKYSFLRRAILGADITAAVIFANTRAETFRITETLRADGLKVDVLNGELSQTEREAALARMRNDEVDFLVATDVAARGIDISGLPSVINFDMPDSPDVYVHRTGRTGRAGQAGVAFSLVTPADVTVYHHLEKFVGLKFEQKPLPPAEQIRERLADRALERAMRGLDADQNLPYGEFLPLAQRLTERPDGQRIVAKLLAAFVEQRQTAGADAPAPAVTVESPAPAPSAAPSTPKQERAPRPAPKKESGSKPDTEPAAAAKAGPDPQKADGADDSRRKRSRSRSRSRDQDRRRSNEDRPPGQMARHMNDDAGARVVSAPTVRPVAASTQNKVDANALLRWMINNTKPGARNRFISSSRMAKELDTSVEHIDVLGDGNTTLERSKNKQSMWRLHPSVWSRIDEGADVSSLLPARAASAAGGPKPPTGNVKLRINVGSSKLADAAALADELAMLSGFDASDFQNIRLTDSQSTVGVPRDYWKDIADALRGASILETTLQVDKID